MSDWESKEINGVRVRNTKDPNEARLMADCAAEWKQCDKVGFDPLVDDLSLDERADYFANRGEAKHPWYTWDLPARPEDLDGWETLTKLERDAILALDYGRSVLETAEILNTTSGSIRAARERAREKLLKETYGRGEEPGCGSDDGQS